jgi:beta-lactamase class C
MMPQKVITLFKLVSASTCLIAASGNAAEIVDECKVKDTVNSAIQPLMEKHGIPGVAVAVTVDGKQCFYNFGVMSKDTQQAVSSETLFEIGSISKTLTATLAAYAQADGRLSLSDNASKYLPSLKGSSFDKVSVLHLATHTAGGLPLQIPDEIQNTDQLMAYYKNWKPRQVPGTSRTYSNPSIGLLGMVVSASMKMPFDDAMEQKLFPALGMTHSFINVPPDQMKHYAQGYNAKDAPVRMNPNPGLIASAAYGGTKTTSADLIRYVGLNMREAPLNPKWQRALTDTQVAQYESAAVAQGLAWERYPYPLKLERLLVGNSETLIFGDNPVSRSSAAAQPQADFLISKTGSTGGFGGYVAFVPAKKIGIVILANKSAPVTARVAAGYQILTQLDQAATKN